jgi:hypothetical protein
MPARHAPALSAPAELACPVGENLVSRRSRTGRQAAQVGTASRARPLGCMGRPGGACITAGDWAEPSKPESPPEPVRSPETSKVRCQECAMAGAERLRLRTATSKLVSQPVNVACPHPRASHAGKPQLGAGTSRHASTALAHSKVGIRSSLLSHGNTLGDYHDISPTAYISLSRVATGSRQARCLDSGHH